MYNHRLVGIGSRVGFKLEFKAGVVPLHAAS